MFTIILDNGHGSNTPGKRSPEKEDGSRFFEWEFNRIVTKLLYQRFKASGYNPIILVPETQDISLSERVRRINNIVKKYDASNCVLLSIHVNAAGNQDKWLSARGWSAWTTKGQNNSDKLAECLYEAAEKIFLADSVLKDSYKEEKTQKLIRMDLSDKDKDWEANYTIIKGANCPAVLTENFFQDNRKDVQLLESQHIIDLIVDVHVHGVRNYINLKSINKI